MAHEPQSRFLFDLGLIDSYSLAAFCGVELDYGDAVSWKRVLSGGRLSRTLSCNMIYSSGSETRCMA